MDEKSVLSQVKRMGGLDYYPKGNDEDSSVARGELVRALYDACESDDHVRRVMDRAMERGFGRDGRACPTPAELRLLASEVPAAARSCVGCKLCNHTGYIITDDCGMASARRCVCHPPRVA